MGSLRATCKVVIPSLLAPYGLATVLLEPIYIQHGDFASASGEQPISCLLVQLILIQAIIICFVFFTCFAASFVLHIGCEMPLVGCEKLLVKGIYSLVDLVKGSKRH